MELKAKPISRWAASFLDCLKHLHQPRRKREKRRVERERERQMSLDLWSSRLSFYPAGLQHLHQPRRKREKTWYRERERERGREKRQMS